MIEIYPPYKGTDKNTGFECMVIALVAGSVELQAVCIGEEGGLYTTPVSYISVDWRYDRRAGVWMSINDAEAVKEAG